MTTATEGRAPTALSVLFDQDTDAAEAWPARSCRPAATRTLAVPSRSSPR